jgi:glyoxylase-like metal-dependent hydrolase (beta-lactamase superfamily II)
MIQIQSFTFSPIQENTYVLYDDSGECVIIDPGCYDEREREKLSSFIDDKKLKPVRLLNTHCHLDHIFGNGYVSSKYNLKPEFNENDLRVFEAFAATCDLYGMNCDPSPPAGNYLNEGDIVTFGNSSLEIFFTPGHSPGSITFYNRAEKFMIAGDVLFYGSIGRTDLPGGNFDTLIESITKKLFSLGDDFKVYSGHGPVTNIGFERKNNPFLK